MERGGEPQVGVGVEWSIATAGDDVGRVAEHVGVEIVRRKRPDAFAKKTEVLIFESLGNDRVFSTGIDLGCSCATEKEQGAEEKARKKEG